MAPQLCLALSTYFGSRRLYSVSLPLSTMWQELHGRKLLCTFFFSSFLTRRLNLGYQSFAKLSSLSMDDHLGGKVVGDSADSLSVILLCRLDLVSISFKSSAYAILALVSARD